MSTPPDDRDDWADPPEPPDRWAEADREWKERWSDKPPEAASGEDVEPPSEDYRPHKTSVRSVADSYEEGMREAGPYLTVGLQIAASMLLFVAAGWALDNWLGTSPWGILGGTALGFAGVMALIVRLAGDGRPRT